MHQPYPPTRRRLWPVFVPFALVVALAAIWTSLWFYAASAAEQAMEGWRAREAKSGRIYECERRTFGGFPFRFEVNCSNPNAELRAGGGELTLRGANIVVVAQVYRPTHLIAECKGPVTVAEKGRPPLVEANWKLGQASMRGTPRAPERVSLAFDEPVVERLLPDGTRQPLTSAKRAELHGRIAEGSVTSNPVLDVALIANGAIATPDLHPLASQPFDAVISATVRGLANFAPKPWPARFREIHERNGRIDITNARIQQDDVIAVSTGSLTINERGNLEGQLQMTAVNIEKVINALDIEGIVSRGRIGATIDKLDRLIPGLGDIARKNAAPGILAGLDVIGKRTTLEGKPALTLPLRFTDGRIMLGPIPVGRAPPLF
jgi:hypothetical protein